MLTVAIPKRDKLQNIIVLTPKDGHLWTSRLPAVFLQHGKYALQDKKCCAGS